jgi:hypothetical protein
MGKTNKMSGGVFTQIDIISEQIARLQKEKRELTEAVVESVKRGIATTGDRLLDKLLLMYQGPPDPEVIARFQKADEMIKGKTGQLVALIEGKEGKSPINALQGLDEELAAVGLREEQDPDPSFRIFLGRITSDELVFQPEELSCALSTARFAEIEPYESKPLCIKEGLIQCSGFPELLDVSLNVHTDHTLYIIEEDFVHFRLIAGDSEVLAWAEKFHRGMHKDVCQRAISRLYRLTAESASE